MRKNCYTVIASASEAIQLLAYARWIATSLSLLAMTEETWPDETT